MGVPSATSQMLEAQSAREAIERDVFLDTQRAARQAHQAQNAHEKQLQDLKNNYRVQTKNVEIAKGTASVFAGEMQVAVDFIMESTGKTFEEVRDMIMKHPNLDLYCDKTLKWLKTSPKVEAGLLTGSRQAIEG